MPFSGKFHPPLNCGSKYNMHKRKLILHIYKFSSLYFENQSLLVIFLSYFADGRTSKQYPELIVNTDPIP